MERKGRESASQPDDGAQVLRPRPAGDPVRPAAPAGDLGGMVPAEWGWGGKAGAGSRREEGAADALPGAQTGGRAAAGGAQARSPLHTCSRRRPGPSTGHGARGLGAGHPWTGRKASWQLRQVAAGPLPVEVPSRGRLSSQGKRKQGALPGEKVRGSRRKRREAVVCPRESIPEMRRLTIQKGNQVRARPRDLLGLCLHPPPVGLPQRPSFSSSL